MKIDVLSSVEGIVIPNKDKNLSSDNKFKNVLNKVTDNVKPLKKEDNENKFNGEKVVSNKNNGDKHIANKGKEETIKKTSIEKDDLRIIEEKSSDNIEEKIDVKDIDQLIFLITALGNKINESMKPLIEELNIDSQNPDDLNLLKQVTEENKEVVQLETLNSKDNSEFINAFNEILIDLKGNEVIRKEGNFNLKEFVKDKTFLGDDKFVEVIESLGELTGFLENIASLKDDSEAGNQMIINEKQGRKGLNDLINKVTSTKENLVELSKVLKAVVKENKNSDRTLGKIVESDEIISVVESKKIDESKKAVFGSNDGVNERKYLEKNKEEKFLNKIIGKENKEEMVLDKIIGNDNNENKFLAPNKFIEFTATSIDDVKQGIDVKTFSIDTAKNIKFMVNNNLKEMVVKVNPGNLGEVSIKLSMVGNEVKANISTTSKDIYSFINANEIKSALGNENLKVSEVNISLYQEDTTFFKNDGGFNEGNGERSNKSYNNNDEFIVLEDNSIEEVNDISSLDIIV